MINLYLDFDGVINIIGHSKLVSSPDIRTARVSRFRLMWRQSVVDWLNSLPEDRVNLIWLTTWNQNEEAMRKLVPRLGITRGIWSLGYEHDFGLCDRDSDWWKYTLLSDMHHWGDKMIWIDDDLRYEPDAATWATDHGALVIAPGEYKGITPDIMERVEKFIRENS